MGGWRPARTIAHRAVSNRCYSSCRPTSTASHWICATRRRGTTVSSCSRCRGGVPGALPRGSMLGSRPITCTVSSVLPPLDLASASRIWRSRVPWAAGRRVQCLMGLAGSRGQIWSITTSARLNSSSSLLFILLARRSHGRRSRATSCRILTSCIGFQREPTKMAHCRPMSTSGNGSCRRRCGSTCSRLALARDAAVRSTSQRLQPTSHPRTTLCRRRHHYPRRRPRLRLRPRRLLRLRRRHRLRPYRHRHHHPHRRRHHHLRQRLRLRRPPRRLRLRRLWRRRPRHRRRRHHYPRRRPRLRLRPRRLLHHHPRHRLRPRRHRHHHPRRRRRLRRPPHRLRLRRLWCRRPQHRHRHSRPLCRPAHRSSLHPHRRHRHRHRHRRRLHRRRHRRALRRRCRRALRRRQAALTAAPSTTSRSSSWTISRARSEVAPTHAWPCTTRMQRGTT